MTLGSDRDGRQGKSRAGLRDRSTEHALFDDGIARQGYRGSTPLYLLVQDRIRASIAAGRFRPDEALPGERDLADIFGVSRVTVRKALQGLVAGGLLQQRHGSGTFVRRKPARVEQALSRLTSFSDDMRLRGLEPSIRVLLTEISPPSPREAMQLMLSPQDRVARLRRLRLAGGIPMAIEHATLPETVLPHPERVGASLYAVLEQSGNRPVRALQRLSAANLDAQEAGLLEVAPGAAALAIERVSFLADGRPVEFTRSWYRGDAYDFVAELTLRRNP